MQRRKAVSTLVAAALYLAVISGSIFLAVNFVIPFAQQVGDTRAIQQMVEKMPEIENVVRSVANAGEGTQQEVSIGFRTGSLRVDPAKDAIIYSIDTESGLIPARASRQFGNILLSAGADVDVDSSTINGTECWLIEGDHVESCIRKLDQPPDSLLGYWAMDDGSGQNVTDGSNHSNTGTRGDTTASESSDPTWVDNCKFGGCLEFDGVDDDVKIPRDPGLATVGDSVSIAGWINGDELDGGCCQGIVTTDFYLLETQSVGVNFAISTDNGTSYVMAGPRNSGVKLANNKWHHLAGIYNSTHVKLYINGKLNATNNITGDISPILEDSYLSIGSEDGRQTCGFCQGSRYFNGRIDEVAIYNYSMSGEEVRARYRTGVFDQAFFEVKDLLVSYRNQDTGLRLGNPEIDALVNNNPNSSRGFGHTEPDSTGQNLGIGRVTAHMRSLSGVDYDMEFTTISGSDFLEVKIQPD